MDLIKKDKLVRINVLIISFILGVGLQSGFSQSLSEKISVPWVENEKISFKQEIYEIPRIGGQDYDGCKPVFSWTKKNGQKNTAYTAKLLVNGLEPAKAADLAYLSGFKIEIPEEPAWHFANSKARNEHYLSLELFPFLKKNGSIYRILDFQLDLEGYAVKQHFEKDFATESVLNDASSSWYKISVRADGVYKLDKNFLQSAGISVSSLNPNHLNVYGNGSGRLPEANNEYRVDDLGKNAILFVGDPDNSFEDGEYFLFYGWGPNSWKHVGGTFRRDLNIYSDDSYYFIRISSTDPAKRIQQVASTTQAETVTVDNYNFYDIYEVESKNLVGGGKRWYGDLFDTELTKSVNFSTPNLVAGGSVDFTSSFASNGNVGGSAITYSVGSQTLLNTSLPTTSEDYARKEVDFSYTTSASNIALTVTVNRANPAILTYLDKIELNARRQLTFTGSQFRFRDALSVGPGNIARFNVGGFGASYFVWDVTDKQEPKIMNGSLSGSVFSFNAATDTLREFVCSNNSTFLTPVFIKEVANQNLHGLGYADLLIVTHPEFLAQAQRLAQIHENDGTSAHVVTTEQVYNEFSSGMLDPTAIKWFAKMFYDRSNGDASLMPKNLLLFGDGTYDPKNRVSDNNYYVPTYQVDNSEDHINALVTDDYFGMLDDNESISNSDMMDIGVGRMIISNNDQAKEMVDKIVQYLREGMVSSEAAICSGSEISDCSSFGDWRQKYIQIADDEEGGYFINQDTEPQYAGVDVNFPFMNVDKIYLDAYQQVTTAGGERFPDVFDAITDRVQRGALVINYVGHGGEKGVAEERVITIPQIQEWSNLCHLNLFVSATCEFTKFDDPSRVSAGEWLYLNTKGGAIALMTTTRSVYFNVNTSIGRKVFENIFQRDASFRPKTFGEIMTLSKNQANSSSNKRSFNLIGDPALRLALPQYRIVTDSINSFSPELYTDTLPALSKAVIKGHVEDFNGNLITDFNGQINPTIYDKKKTIQTLGQNDDSPVIPFETQKNILYKGKCSVTNGKFEFSFIVPKDIRYDYGFGKISLYGNTPDADAGGAEKRVIIGGIDPNGINDNAGPEITLYLNTEEFVNGGLTDESPTLVAELFDENGINTVGNGIGHDIMAVIDQESASPIVLNDYYNADLDTYQSGSVRYQLQNLEPGTHSLSFKVWDVNNNSSEASIEFEVRKKEDFELRHVLNYPNPFTTSTSFFFEHNQLCANLEVQVQIFTVSGRLVKTINRLVYNECYRSDEITWDGRDDYGDQLAKGVYIYRLAVTNPDNEKAEKLEKLVILK
ncbi:MAG: type IX secretion system sortase PorU [Bacteroidota bacterium]